VKVLVTGATGVEDVAAGHWLASQHGKVGQRYILGNENLTLRDFFESIACIAGRIPSRMRLPHLPVLIVAYVDEAISWYSRRRSPAVPVTGVRMAGKYMFFDCSRAGRELHLPQSPVQAALKKAIDWFCGNGYVSACGGR
jgi:dihydroflavonol-4-reductase